MTDCSAKPAVSPEVTPVADPAAQYQVELSAPSGDAAGTIPLSRTLEFDVDAVRF
jgi:hypothetical protein